MLEFREEDIKNIDKLSLTDLTIWLIYICDNFEKGKINRDIMYKIVEKAKNTGIFLESDGVTIRKVILLKIGKRRKKILENFLT